VLRYAARTLETKWPSRVKKGGILASGIMGITGLGALFGLFTKEEVCSYILQFFHEKPLIAAYRQS
jgi:hypothetical protein